MDQVEWSKLITLEYWLEGIAGNSAVTPIVEQGTVYFWSYINVFIGFFSLGVLLLNMKVFLNHAHPLSSRLNSWGSNFIWMGILGMTWFILRQIEVGFLGSRIWLLIGFCWLLFLLYFILRYLVVYFPLEYSFYKKSK